MFIGVRRFYLDLVPFSPFFSVVFCFLCSIVDSMLGFWVFLELCGLSIIPCFFYSGGVSIYGFYSSLLTYIIMSGVSSVLLVSGVLFSGLYLFIYFGFAVKFGLFPTILWVYRVFSESNWFFIFFLSVILKFPVLFFCFLFQGCNLWLVYGDCFFTILVCSGLVWFFSNDWTYVWCHVSLSSISTLVVACFCAEPIVCFFVYFYYFIWSTFCILFFFSLEDNKSFFGGAWVFCFLLLVTPLSLPLFYKLGVCISIFYSSFYLLFVWSLYSFSEQFFLFKLWGDYFYSSSFNFWV
uniref:NADH dehydrogenase subunit 2 n=1 Tax=Mosgovoyia sp. SQ20 TaxID=2854040 RepID=UPI001F144CAC|nr:NADH dehydrogenase subunit 2 [Mosgovoyia sp. SQ20]UKS08003.1 NADH dehydrogenase subunit 2 [Mosgovoyia sp. SQ20]